MLNKRITGIRAFDIQRLTDQFEPKADFIAEEEPLEIVLSYIQHGKPIHKTLSITMRTPGDDENLVRGFLFTEGILPHPAQQIDRFEYRFSCVGDMVEQQTIVVHLKLGILPAIEQLDRHFYTNSSCGVCGKTSIDLMMDNCSYLLKKDSPILSSKILYKLPDELNQTQNLFQKTGGIHACALFDNTGKLLHRAEDIGRHNALDKLIGMALLQQMLPLDNNIILLSGRASFELIHKSAMAGAAIVVAIGAPSSLAIETAQAMGMTLIGFLKNQSANIYCGSQRIHIE